MGAQAHVPREGGEHGGRGQGARARQAAGIAIWGEIEALDDRAPERRLSGAEAVDAAVMVRPEPDCAWIRSYGDHDAPIPVITMAILAITMGGTRRQVARRIRT